VVTIREKRAVTQPLEKRDICPLSALRSKEKEKANPKSGNQRGVLDTEKKKLSAGRGREVVSGNN